MRDNPGGGQSDPAEGVRRGCKKNSPSRGPTVWLPPIVWSIQLSVLHSFFCIKEVFYELSVGMGVGRGVKGWLYPLM